MSKLSDALKMDTESNYSAGYIASAVLADIWNTFKPLAIAAVKEGMQDIKDRDSRMGRTKKV